LETSLIKRFFPYLLGACWIALWWITPFFIRPPVKIALPTTCQSHINRELLKKSLAGDLPSMHFLLKEWQNATPDELVYQTALAALENLQKKPLNFPEKCFFPQTYPSACFLMALTTPQAIISLPRGFTHREHVFQFTENIPEFPHSYAEFLWRRKPCCSFISTYSNPSFVNTLRALEIPYQRASAFHSIQEVSAGIRTIGTLILCAEKAELLILFMQAALKAIDQELQRSYTKRQIPPQALRKVFLFHHLHYTLPNAHSLTGELLKRLDFAYLGNQQGFQTTLVTLEQLHAMDPDLLIIASEDLPHLEKELSTTPLFSRLKATQKNALFYVDSIIQHSPTQFLVLAYYDIAQGILHFLNQTENVCQ
jgi:iron complex transport system substrate-binding protein